MHGRQARDAVRPRDDRRDEADGAQHGKRNEGIGRVVAVVGVRFHRGDILVAIATQDNRRLETARLCLFPPGSPEHLLLRKEVVADQDREKVFMDRGWIQQDRLHLLHAVVDR